MTDVVREVSSAAPPAGGAPPRRSPLSVVRVAWRQLTSMRTALVLLFLLALSAVPGSLLPQRGLNPARVQQFFHAHPHLAPLLDRLWLFDVFSAPWFAAVYLLLCVSIAGCVLPRLAVHLKAMRSGPPAVPRRLDRLEGFRTWRTDAAVDDVLDAAAAGLRSLRYRMVVRRPGTLAAEKGRLRESGNLVFHASLLLLLVGVALGGLFGYKGSVLVPVGDGFADTRAAYDTFSPGRLFHDGMLAPFSFTLLRFRASYQPSGEPRAFDALVSYRPTPTAPARLSDVRVNHPLVVDGAKVYLISHGYAPRFVVRGADGRVAFDGPVPFLPQDGEFTSTGVVKVPDARPQQLGFSGYFFPTVGVAATGLVSVYPDLDRPAVTLLAYRGNLGLDSGIPQSVYALDTAQLHRVSAFLLRPGQTQRLPGGGSITFAGVDDWAIFQVTHDPGRGTALGAGVLLLAGLLVTLRSRRRRMFVAVHPAPDDGDPGRTVVEVAGLARTEADDVADDVRALVARLAGAPDQGPQEGWQ